MAGKETTVTLFAMKRMEVNYFIKFLFIAGNLFVVFLLLGGSD